MFISVHPGGKNNLALIPSFILSSPRRRLYEPEATKGGSSM